MFGFLESKGLYLLIKINIWSVLIITDVFSSCCIYDVCLKCKQQVGSWNLLKDLLFQDYFWYEPSYYCSDYYNFTFLDYIKKPFIQ